MKKKTSKYDKLVNAILQANPKELKTFCKILGKMSMQTHEQALFNFMSDLVDDKRTDFILSTKETQFIEKLNKR